MKILLVEDDFLLGEAIQASLTYESLSVDWFTDGISAENAISLTNYDGAILDICIPGKTGIEVLKNIRRQGNDLPVIILTALGTVSDRVTGLDHGADDYMVKPFDITELSARLRALVRRSKGRVLSKITHHDIVVMPDTKTVTKGGITIDLSRQEYLILTKLLENQDRLFSQQDLTTHIYSWDKEIGSNTVEVYIHYLRKKFGKSLIRNKRGVGYVIERSR
ncbi:MAG: two-component system response regulator QseB [Gammaproteobacteria bacterium]|jgi:two-component system response regulator QseB